MAFKLIAKDVITRRVEIITPQDLGRDTKEYIDVTYKFLSKAALKELVDDKENMEADGLEQMKKYVVDIKGVMDEEGEVPYSESLLEKLMNITYVAGPLMTEFWGAQTNAKVVRRKN